LCATPVRAALAHLPRRYWQTVALGASFTLARFSEAFLILRAQQLGLPPARAPLVLVVMSAVYAASAYPFGRLGDGMSRARGAARGGGAAAAISSSHAGRTGWKESPVASAATDTSARRWAGRATAFQDCPLPGALPLRQ
jgi:hypothetical protein